MGPILIADDDECVRMVLCQLLEDEGYFCEEVENGACALEWVLNHEIEIVITDNQMPMMSGLEFMESLQKIPLFHSPQIIFLTGNPSETIRNKARQAGACAVLLKPYDRNELLGTIRTALTVAKREKQCV